MSELTPEQAFNIARVQALHQAKIIVAEERGNTSDPRVIMRMLDKLDYLINATPHDYQT